MVTLLLALSGYFTSTNCIHVGPISYKYHLYVLFPDQHTTISSKMEVPFQSRGQALNGVEDCHLCRAVNRKLWLTPDYLTDEHYIMIYTAKARSTNACIGKICLPMTFNVQLLRSLPRQSVHGCGEGGWGGGMMYLFVLPPVLGEYFHTYCNGNRMGFFAFSYLLVTAIESKYC